MNVTVREVGNDIAILDFEGRIDASSAVPIKTQITNLQEQNRKDFLINLADVSFINSSGLGILISILREVQQKGGHLKLLNPQPYIVELLEITQLKSIFEIFDDESEGLNSFS